MGKLAIALDDRCTSRVAMNGQAAVASVITLRELEQVSAHRRLAGDVAEAVVGPPDMHRNPRLAFMRRTDFEDKVLPVASSFP